MYYCLYFKIMELVNCFSENGKFIDTKYFVQKYNKLPCSLCLTFNEENKHCDLEKITNDLLFKIVPDIQFVRRITNKYTIVGGASDQEERIENNLNLSEGGSNIQIFAENKIYTIDYNSISVKYADISEEIVQSILQNIYNQLPMKKPDSKEAVANLVGYSDGEYYTVESKIKKVDVNIEENYNDDFIPVYNDLLKFLDSRESGLILLYGAAGTGKSNLLRHLCNKYPKQYVIVPTSLTSRLGDPDFVSFMIDNANSVFILEDCEQVLMDRGVNMFNGAISNILNMSDGLLSDIMNIKFICTFNADIKTIDQALLRKGRCYAKYEFKELESNKVQYLNDKYNLGIEEIKPMTLAEIYNADKTEYSEKKKMCKIGF